MSSDHDCDVAIVGAGAAGATLAFMLARAGKRVVVLERGARRQPEKFENNEYVSMPSLYLGGGPRSTEDNDISFLQGEGVGGSTVINNAIWMRADLDELLPRWANDGAIINRGRLEKAYQQLESWLHVQSIPPEMISGGTKLFLDGCAQLQLPSQVLEHNRQDCLGCGWCNYGCRYNRKTSALVTFIPWAEKLGADIRSDCKKVTLERNGGKVTRVRYERDGNTESLTAKHFVVSCGAIGSSALLLSSGINPNGRVGRRFHALGGVLAVAEAPTPIDGFDKIGLCAASIPADRRYILETFFSPPGAIAMSIPGWGERHAARMKRFRHFAQAGAMIGTASSGRIRLKDGQAQIQLKLSGEEIDALRDGLKELASIYLAAGAERVYPGTRRETVITDNGQLDVLDEAFQKLSDVTFGSAHPQGGNVMSDDAAVGVVDSHFRVHEMDNLSVVDASVIPTNLWANCQATVMALAHVASDCVAAGI